MEKLICSKLHEIEKENNVKILLSGEAEPGDLLPLTAIMM